MKIDISHLTLPAEVLTITDYYILEDNPNNTIMYPGPKMLVGNPDYLDFIKKILEEIKKIKNNKLEFGLEFYHSKYKKILLRGNSINTLDGTIYILRKLPSIIPKLEELGIHRKVMEIITSEKLSTGGLILISGEPGQGKTTTAASIVAHRLKTLNSFCLTIEDPIEMPLQGIHVNPLDSTKKGICFQTSITENFDIQDAIKSSLRCYPATSNGILYLGEIRDPKMAIEVLKIAANGQLVITTMHGSNIVASLKRFISLAVSSNSLGESEVKSLFSTVFKLLIHQRLETSFNKKILRQQIVYSDSDNSLVSNRLKSESLELLNTEIQRQNATIERGESLLNEK